MYLNLADACSNMLCVFYFNFFNACIDVVYIVMRVTNIVKYIARNVFLVY